MIPLKLLQITIFLLLSSSLIQSENPNKPRKLDENPAMENKCGDCPCDNPCNPQPALPPPSHPPPSPPPSPPPPPPPKNPTTPSYDCPPPPFSPSGQKPPKGTNPPYIYINGPPGSVYPVYPYYSGGRRGFSIGKIPFLVGFVLWVVAV